MGLLGKVGKWTSDRWGKGPSVSGLKSSVKGTAKFAGKVAPYALGALAIPGVGGALGGALGMGGAAAGAAGAAGAGGAAGAAGIGAGIMGALKGADGKFGMDDIGRGIKSVGGLGGLAQGAIGGLSAYEGYKGNQEADKLARESLEMAKGAYADRAPLRDMGLAKLTGASAPDLSRLFASNAGNPYYTPSIPSVGAGPTAPVEAAPIAPESPVAPPMPAARPGALPSVGGGLWGKIKRQGV